MSLQGRERLSCIPARTEIFVKYVPALTQELKIYFLAITPSRTIHILIGLLGGIKKAKYR